VNLIVRFVRIERTAAEGGGGIAELVVHGEPVSGQNKPKAFIHWVANPVKCEVRLYEKLYVYQQFLE
jgi:glutaminyl-tRNA synthetase